MVACEGAAAAWCCLPNAQIAELEKTLGKMQQQLGSLRTIGEQELINIPRGESADRHGGNAWLLLLARRSARCWARMPGLRAGTGNGQAVTTFMPATYLRRRECSALAFVDCHMFQIEVQVVSRSPAFLKRAGHPLCRSCPRSRARAAPECCACLQYRECLLEWRRRELAERLAFLQEVSCCRQLKQQALMAMDNSLQWITVPRGSVLQVWSCTGLGPSAQHRWAG